MPAADGDLVRFMHGMVDVDGRAAAPGPEVVDAVTGLLRSDVVPRLRRLLESGQVDARAWFGRLVPALADLSREYIRAVVSGDPAGLLGSSRMDRHMLGCELVTALADLAGSQAELAMQIVERRLDHDGLLVDTALAILSKLRDESPERYLRMKHAITTQGFANREGKSIAHLAEHVPGEMERLVEALTPGTDEPLRQFAIDVLEEHPGRANEVMPHLRPLVSRRKVPHRTRLRAMSALATYAAAGDATRERDVVRFLARFADDPASGIRVQVYALLGRLQRHPTLTVPVLLKGLWDDGEGHDDDFLPYEEAVASLDRYVAPPEVQELLAEDVRARTRHWQEGGDRQFRGDDFVMIGQLATGPGPVLDALTAPVAAVEARTATMPRTQDGRKPEVVSGQRQLSSAVRRITEKATRIG